MFYSWSTLALGTLLVSASPGVAAEVRGVVSKIDPDKKLLVLEARGLGLRGQVFTFALTAETQVLRGGQPGKLSDLTAGKRVRVVYETRNGQTVATSISSVDLLGLVEQVVPLIPKLEPAPPVAPTAPLPNDANTVSGELRRVAYTDRELVVLSGPAKRETILSVPEELSVTKGGKPAQFEDLKEGEQAVVRFEQRGHQRVARAVQVGESLPTAAGNSRIQQIRRVLKIVDGVLDLADKSKP